MLKKNENAYSMGRVCTLYAVLQWSIITLYLAFTGKVWQHYDMLTYATVGFVVIILCDKTFQGVHFSVGNKGGANE